MQSKIRYDEIGEVRVAQNNLMAISNLTDNTSDENPFMFADDSAIDPANNPAADLVVPTGDIFSSFQRPDLSSKNVEKQPYTKGESIGASSFSF